MSNESRDITFANKKGPLHNAAQRLRYGGSIRDYCLTIRDYSMIIRDYSVTIRDYFVLFGFISRLFGGISFQFGIIWDCLQDALMNLGFHNYMSKTS